MKALPLLAAVYLISPIDLIPDVVPIIGWLDDVGVLALVLGVVVRSMRLHAAAPTPAVQGQARSSVDTAGVETAGAKVRGAEVRGAEV